jgi:hypothetical protein
VKYLTLRSLQHICNARAESCSEVSGNRPSEYTIRPVTMPLKLHQRSGRVISRCAMDHPVYADQSRLEKLVVRIWRRGWESKPLNF